jgi:LacI family transcriptional regulator
VDASLPTPERPPGIRDVARAAGVSVASASVALNHRPGVAADTRARILAAAEQLGYRAHPQARALRSGHSNTFGLVVRNLGNPFFLDIISGAEEVASAAGATVLFLDSHYSVERERHLVEAMAAQRVDGLAIAPVGTGQSIRLWQELRPGMPAVALNATVDGIPDVSRVMPDNAAALELPMSRLAELGHVKVAFLSAPRPLMADPDRLRHFRRLVRALGLQSEIWYTPLNLAAAQSTVEARLARPERATAVIANSDYVAQAVYRAARRIGLAVGPDVSVVGHDDLPTSELLDPPLATLAVDRLAMGRALMQRLLEVETGDHVEPVEWVERASVRAATLGVDHRRPTGARRPPGLAERSRDTSRSRRGA